MKKDVHYSVYLLNCYTHIFVCIPSQIIVRVEVYSLFYTFFKLLSLLFYDTTEVCIFFYNRQFYIKIRICNFILRLSGFIALFELKRLKNVILQSRSSISSLSPQGPHSLNT